MTASERMETALRAAEAGGEVAASLFRRDVEIETKDGETDFVTRADREAQDAVVDVVHDQYPGDVIVGEENDERKTVPESGAAWVIDPIDGTNNYVREMRTWATSVAAVVDGRPVAAANVMPALGDTYVTDGETVRRNGTAVETSDRTDPRQMAVSPTIWWDTDRRAEYAAATREIVERFADLSRIRCAQATLSLVAAGSLDATITNVQTNPWDTVAGVHMVETAGGTVTDLDGDRWSHASRGLVASNGECHEEVLAAARAIDDATDDATD